MAVISMPQVPNKLLLVDDEEDVLYSFRRVLSSPALEILTAASGEEALRMIPAVKPDLVIMDLRLGGMNGLETLRRIRQSDARLPVILMTAYGTAQSAIEAMKLGAYDYILKPFDVPRLKQLVSEALTAARAMKEVVALEPWPEQEESGLGLIGRTEAMQRVLKLIGQLAGSDATVLITGESGTGKELVARAIYQHSRRSKQAFLAINCAAIPETLLESELFGHAKGAFTGASSQRIGKFEQCNGGTLFLDEIGDMSLATQTRLLRVLQSGTFERVGGNQTLEVDVRVIAATNKPLEQAVASHQFREDLFYRLNVVRIHLPPLRERRADIPLLVQYFLRKFATGRPPKPKPVAPAALAALEAYHWPGNVRELENALQRAIVVGKGDALMREDLPSEVWGGAPVATAGGLPPPQLPPASEGMAARDPLTLAREMYAWARQDPQRKVIAAVERELIVAALQETRGNQVQAARLLGITRATLRNRIARYGITREVSVR